MTGYGQATADLPGARVTVEVRSVNNRFADLRLRLPEALSGWEPEVRRRVLARVKRGRVEVALRVERAPGASAPVALDREVLAGVVAVATAMHEEFGVAGTLDLASALRVPGVLRVVSDRDVLDAASAPELDDVLERALEAHDADRRREGESLRVDLVARAERMLALTGTVLERAGEVPLLARRKLEERLASLASGLSLDPGRLAQEAAFLADRADVTEETVRLRGHLEQLRALLGEGVDEPVGKRLDFLLQEIHRETNTICSKSSDLELSRRALDLKAESEKVREQIQNLE
ncbi:MAG TPA: YicC/YloC family endoribonuclease [Candidatus Polarisedimenticolaceae bacterium]